MTGSGASGSTSGSSPGDSGSSPGPGPKPKRPEQVLAIIQETGGATLAVIAERLSITRDAAWGSTRVCVVAGQVKREKVNGQTIFVEIAQGE
jgi:hypothetical protein